MNNFKISLFIERFIFFTIINWFFYLSHSILKFHEININNVQMNWISIFCFAVSFTIFSENRSENIIYLNRILNTKFFIMGIIILSALGMLIDYFQNDVINIKYLFISVAFAEMGLLISIITIYFYKRLLRRFFNEKT